MEQVSPRSQNEVPVVGPSSKNRCRFLVLWSLPKTSAVSLFFGRYPKPVPYFYPVASAIERAIKQSMEGKYLATVRVDGINKKIAAELTNALRANGVSLKMVEGKKDEGEPLIRLADMWAGCIRSALLNEKDTLALFRKALETRYLQVVS